MPQRERADDAVEERANVNQNAGVNVLQLDETQKVGRWEEMVVGVVVMVLLGVVVVAGVPVVIMVDVLRLIMVVVVVEWLWE